MTTPWDDSLKILFSEHAQDFASWVLEGAQVLNKLSTEFAGRKAVADGLLEVSWQNEPLLMHFEFQSSYDPEMPQRMLGYAWRAMQEHRRTVHSCLIYLRDVGQVPQPPWYWTIPGNRHILQFHYVLMELAKMTPDELRQTGLQGMLPLMLLTKGGNTQETAEEVMSTLEAEGKRDSLSATAVLASLVLHGDGDLDWLKRRFAAMEEYASLEEIWFIQEFMNRAREREQKRLEGQWQMLQQERQALQEEQQVLQERLQKEQQVLQERLQKEQQVLQERLQEEHEVLQGEHEVLQEERQKALQDLRDLFVNIVERRFTDNKLALMARGRASALQDFKPLEHLIFTMSIAQNAQEAEQALLS